MSVSIVIPVYNEIDNIEPMHAQLEAIVERLDRECEVVFVNDGSNDGTEQALDQLADQHHYIKVVHFRRNFGQTAAMQAGLQFATGDAIVTLDGDLQNDPADIPMMLAKLDEGYDLVHGWRKHRQDAFINRKLPSMIANWIISRTTGFPVHDLGCTLKAFRSEVAKDLNLYGEMHRFIPILAYWRGAKCVEVETHHRARQFGTTKYGIGRTLGVVLDLITVKYLTHYSGSPMRLFGTLGMLCALLSTFSGSTSLIMKLFAGFDLTGNPLLYVSLFSAMIGLQFFSIGMLGEVTTRTYYESQDKQPYTVRRTVNMQTELKIRRAA